MEQPLIPLLKCTMAFAHSLPKLSSKFEPFENHGAMLSWNNISRQHIWKGEFELEQIDIIKDFLINNIISDTDNINLGYEDSLIESGMIDSLGIIKLITFLKDEFTIDIDDEDIMPENFESIQAINAFVNQKKAKKG